MKQIFVLILFTLSFTAPAFGSAKMAKLILPRLGPSSFQICAHLRSPEAFQRMLCKMRMAERNRLRKEKKAAKRRAKILPELRFFLELEEKDNN